MTLQELYEALGGDYSDVTKRLPTEKMIDKFALKYLNDTSFNELKEALGNKDIETAFRAAHTLKGVALNLAFSELAVKASELTEALRENHRDGYTFDQFVEMFDIVEAAQNKTVDAINRYASEKTA
ncbi:MAG: Hpt domain-containing protein [Erysipelotrichaceae bacterium]|nr:Hpt domain-containing protein [Erysipelotrichaceae bacterium]